MCPGWFFQKDPKKKFRCNELKDQQNTQNQTKEINQWVVGNLKIFPKNLVTNFVFAFMYWRGRLFYPFFVFSRVAKGDFS